jgi:hypothetical protein
MHAKLKVGAKLGNTTFIFENDNFCYTVISILGTNDILQCIPHNAFGRTSKLIIARWFLQNMMEHNGLYQGRAIEI